LNANNAIFVPAERRARLAGLSAVCLLLVVSGWAGEKKPVKSLTRIYRFSELMARSESIAVCEVRSARVGSARLRVINWLKGPPDEAARWLQEQRATVRLAREANKDDEGKKADPELDIEIEVIAPFKPPAAGTQNLFFLWERLEKTEGLPLRYRVAHPQCVYESLYAAEVRSELARARTAPRRAYLRPWDAKMAALLTQRRQTETLLRLKPGHSEKGLRMAVRFAKASLLSPGSFDVSVRIENLMDAEQAIYDGPLPSFGVRLRKKGDSPEQALVLLAVDEGVRGGPGADILARVDVNDFISVPKRDQLIKTLHFDIREHPKLKGLKGEFLASAFYISAKDGKGLDGLPGVPWVGTLVSDEAPLMLAPAVKP
jgi:hypothetical protein